MQFVHNQSYTDGNQAIFVLYPSNCSGVNSDPNGTQRVNLRLQEIFGGSECFGSKNVLFVGDLLQLLPVEGEPVFAKVPQKDVASKLQGLTSVNLWKDSIVYDELTINKRQKKDQEFSSMLDCVRRRCPTEETMSTLQKRIIDVSPVEKFLELQESGS